jgi:hypothetical protein
MTTAPEPETSRAEGLVEPEGVNAGSDVGLAEAETGGRDGNDGRTDVEGGA